MKRFIFMLIMFLLCSCASNNYTGRYADLHNGALKVLSAEDAKNFTDFCINFDKQTEDFVKKLSIAFKKPGYNELKKELEKQKPIWDQIFSIIKMDSNHNNKLVKMKFAYIRNDLFHWAYYYEHYGPKIKNHKKM